MRGLLRYKFLSIFILLSGLLFGFQNCSFTQPGMHATGSSKVNRGITNQSGSTTFEVGGEQGYEGKSVYGQRRVNGLCKDGSEIETKIEVDQGLGTATYTRENCQNVSRSADLSSLDILPHNLDNFSNDIKVFERMENNSLPEGKIFAYCRGLNSFGTIVADVIIRQKNDGDYIGRVVTGNYDSNGYLGTIRDTGVDEVRRWSSPNWPDNAYFSFYNGQGERTLHFSVKSGLGITKGSINYYIPPDDEHWDSIWNIPCVRLMD